MNDYSHQDFDIRGTVLVKYNGNAAHVTVPTGVTVIGAQAFADKPTLQSIELPDTVTAIEYKAFLNCPALEYVTIPQSVTELGQLLFWGSVQATVYTPEGSAAAEYAKDRRMLTKPKPQPRILPTPSALGIPANWDPKDHPLLACRQKGDVRQLRGRILITVYLVTDTESAWTTEYECYYRRFHDEATRDLEQAASQRNIPLRIDTVYKRFKATTKCTCERRSSWLDRWETQCPPDPAQGYDEKPVILAVNKELRSFARMLATTGPEVSVIGRYGDLFSNNTIIHELCHNFGAPDLYEPAKVQKLAALYLPDSIMNDGIIIDALTAYCIGWTDTLSPEALAFLWETRNMNL